jgi:hypothetical protein
MAITIKSIPVLKNEVAQKFVEKADRNYTQKASVDFSKQVSIANKILSKANLK